MCVCVCVTLLVFLRNCEGGLYLPPSSRRVVDQMMPSTLTQSSPHEHLEVSVREEEEGVEGDDVAYLFPRLSRCSS